MNIKELFRLNQSLHNELLSTLQSTAFASKLVANIEAIKPLLEPYKIDIPDRIQDYNMEASRLAKIAESRSPNNKKAIREYEAAMEKLDAEYETDKKEFQAFMVTKEKELESIEAMYTPVVITDSDLPSTLTAKEYVDIVKLIKPIYDKYKK